MKLRNISKKYINSKGVEVSVLNNINVEFKKGKFYGIIGKSGSGKTTLINILGLLDDYQEGEYLIEDNLSKHLTEDEKSELRMEKFGFVFQSFYLNDKLTAVENVIIPMLINSNISKKERREKAISLLEKFGLKDRINHYPKELSGGEKQRVALARALANNPEVIIADEPTGNLDEENEKIIFDYLKELAGNGKCVIVVSHNNILSSYADKLFRLEDGNIYEEKWYFKRDITFHENE